MKIIKCNKVSNKKCIVALWVFIKNILAKQEQLNQWCDFVGGATCLFDQSREEECSRNLFESSTFAVPFC